jgi:hypothetical protein
MTTVVLSACVTTVPRVPRHIAATLSQIARGVSPSGTIVGAGCEALATIEVLTLIGVVLAVSARRPASRVCVAQATRPTAANAASHRKEHLEYSRPLTTSNALET